MKWLKEAHFNRKGIWFYPVSLSGRLIMLAALVYLAAALVRIHHSSHSAGDTLISWSFEVVVTWSVYTTLALFLQVFSRVE